MPVVKPFYIHNNHGTDYYITVFAKNNKNFAICIDASLGTVLEFLFFEGSSTDYINNLMNADKLVHNIGSLVHPITLHKTG